jgi:hypothetical protein
MKGVTEMKNMRILISIFLVMAVLPSANSQVGGLDIAYTTGEITADPASDIWQEATPITVNLMPQQIASPSGGKDVSITVRGLHNEEFIGFLMEWEDPTKDTKVTGEVYRDSGALQFPLDPNNPPSPFMGDPGLVNIWFWRGDWQADLEGEEYIDAEYPAFGGFYFPQDEQLFLKEIVGGNIIRASPVEDLSAKGFGTLESQDHQDVAGNGVYADGKWRVVFVRPMTTSDEFDVQFKTGMPSKINFAVWDGSNNDRGGQKSVSFAWKDIAISEISAPEAMPIPPVPEMIEETKEVRGPTFYLGIFAALLVGIVLGAIFLWAVDAQIGLIKRSMKK